MIITRDVDVQMESTFSGETVKMGVDQGAMQHIMAILSEQYSDPMEAVVREYSTNAIDSQVAAGWTRPVELTSPTMLNSVFKVQDFGLGMDADDIRDVYSNYGASTKRDSNDFNGTMGIGSKSAFAYTNQFTVVGVKGGVRTTVVVSRDDEGGGDMQIVDVSATDEPNGVTITVPVSDWLAFHTRVNRVAKAMPQGMLLVDGEDISAWPTYKKVVGTIRDSAGNVVVNAIYHTRELNYYSPNDTIYMGGVQYPALSDLSPVRTSPAYSIMADVPLGAVQFAPSREALKDVRSTREMHEKISKIYVDHLAVNILKDVEAATNIFDAVSIFSRNRAVLQEAGHESLSWRGTPLAPRNVLTGADRYNPRAKSWNVFDSRGERTRQPAHGLPIVQTNIGNSVFVKNYPKIDSISSGHKAKVVHWFKEHYTRPDYWDNSSKDLRVVFVEDIPDTLKSDPVLKHIEWVDWADIAAIKMPRKFSTSAPRQARGGKHDVWVADKHRDELVDMDDLEVDNIYFFVRSRLRSMIIDSNYGYGVSAADFLDDLLRRYSEFKGGKTAIVSVYANSVDKFRRELPKAKEITDFRTMVNELADHKLEQHKPELIIHAGWQATQRSNALDTVRAVVRNLGDAALLDKDIVALAKRGGKSMNTYMMFSDSPAHRIKADKIVEEAAKSVQTQVDDAEACYPMLSMVVWGYSNSRDKYQVVADYMNNIYREKEQA